MKHRFALALFATVFVLVGPEVTALTVKTASLDLPADPAEALRTKELDLLQTLKTPNQTGDDLLEAAKKLYRLRAGRELCEYSGDQKVNKNNCGNQLLQIYAQASPQGRTLMSLCDTAPDKDAKMDCTGKYDEITIDLKSLNDQPDAVSNEVRKMDRTPEQLKSFVSSNLAYKLKELSEKFLRARVRPSSLTVPVGER